LFLERNLYPNSMLINVKILIPPSTGIHGGGQQGGPLGMPGWAYMKKHENENKTIDRNLNFKFIVIQY